MNSRNLLCVTALAALSLVTCGLTAPARAGHEPSCHDARRDVHREYRERLRAVDCWYDEQYDRLRCDYDRSRKYLERELQEARRCRVGEHRDQIDALRRALDDLHCEYRNARKALRNERDCRRRDLRAWYRAALQRCR